jgi:hypothetical protein
MNRDFQGPRKRRCELPLECAYFETPLQCTVQPAINFRPHLYLLPSSLTADLSFESSYKDNNTRGSRIDHDDERRGMFTFSQVRGDAGAGNGSTVLIHVERRDTNSEIDGYECADLISRY